MVTRMISVVAALLLCGHAEASKVFANVAPYSLASVSVEEDALSVSEMQSVFARSEKAHLHSMNQISKSLTMPKAMGILNQLTNSSALEDVVSFWMNGQDAKTSFMAKGKKQPSGYSGIDGARQLLNDMIYDIHSQAHDHVQINGKREFNNLWFEVVDVDGRIVDTHGLPISFSIIFEDVSEI